MQVTAVERNRQRLAVEHATSRSTIAAVKLCWSYENKKNSALNKGEFCYYHDFENFTICLSSKTNFSGPCIRENMITGILTYTVNS